MTKSTFRGVLFLSNTLFLSTVVKSKSSYLSKNDIILIETFCRIDDINIIMKRDLNSHIVEVYLSFVKLQWKYVFVNGVVDVKEKVQRLFMVCNSSSIYRLCS